MWMSNKIDPPIVFFIPIKLSQGQFLQLHLQILIFPLKIYDDRVEEVDLMCRTNSYYRFIINHTDAGKKLLFTSDIRSILFKGELKAN